MKTEMSTTPASLAPGVFVLSQEQESMGDLASAFKKLSAATPKVNEATDAANTAFRATEEILASNGVGLEAQIEVVRLDDTTTRSERGTLHSVTQTLHLVYRRIAGKYRIGFEVVEDNSINPTGGPEDWEFLGGEKQESIPWDQASRAWKLRGVVKLYELIDDIASSASRISEEASAATSVLADVLADLEVVASKRGSPAPRSRPKYKLNGGREHIPDELAEFSGKTIARIEYGIDPEKHPKTHGGDAMTLYFTDGSDLEIRLGSNVENLGIDSKTVTKLYVDMMLFPHEAPKKAS